MFDTIPYRGRYMANGRTVLITGATSGIGLETAERFAEHGFNVYATAREPEKATALKELAEKHPFFIRIVKLDVTDTEENITAIIKNLGPIHVLINNAGMGLIGPVHTTTDAQRRKVFDTNLFGLLNVTCAVLDGMIAENLGRSSLSAVLWGHCPIQNKQPIQPVKVHWNISWQF